jgi:hypothetical protein
MKTYERKSFPRMARDLKVMYEKGNLSFDNAVQRSFVWKNTSKDNRMSMLIDSMMRGLPVPPMYCNCIFEDVKSKIYDFLDGKQRVTTIVKFLKDEFPLVNIPTFEDEEGNEQDFNGLVYSQLPEEVQDTIKTYSLTVYYYENMDQEDAEEMFRRLNNGKSLTAIELTRANAASGDKIRRMASHDLFDLALSEKSLASYANEDVVIKTWVLLYSNKKSFETKYIRPVMKESVITEDQMEEINNIFDEFLSVCKDLQKNKPKIAKKILGKNHMISIMPIMQKAVRDNIDLKVVKEWIVDFFGTETRDISVNSRYNEFAKGRIAVTEEAVNIRTRILNDSFSEFFMPE